MDVFVDHGSSDGGKNPAFKQDLQDEHSRLQLIRLMSMKVF